MGKLVLGIAAVLCLDIAFIAYLYSTKDPELQAVVKPASPRRPRPPKIAFPPPPNQPSVIKEPAPAVQAKIAHKEPRATKPVVAKKNLRSHEMAAVPRKNRMTVAVRKSRAKKADKNYAISSQSRRSSSQKIKNDTGTTILYYGSRSGNDAPTVASVRPRKVSFASRAVAIIKKAVDVAKGSWLEDVLRSPCVKFRKLTKPIPIGFFHLFCGHPP